MRRMTAVGAVLGLISFAGACAATGGARGASYQAAPTALSGAEVQQFIAVNDSLRAQRIADREGPRVSIQAAYVNTAGARRVQGTFSLDDDAYVLVGHIDGDGVLRIVFPLNPDDDGFVRGQRTYRTQEFFAGFSDQFRPRFGSTFLTQSHDAYDAQSGYLFIVAAWRPMRFDQFQTDGRWDSFELTDADYMNNPRPAVHEFAALLAGETREAYTVQFARYYNTAPLYATSFGRSSIYGHAMCAGYAPSLFPFGLSPFAFGGGLFGGPDYSQTLLYRGNRYYYDSLGDCYQQLPRYTYTGYGLAGVPQPVVPPTRRGVDAASHRTPVNPVGVAPHTLPAIEPEKPTSGATAPVELPRVSPRYRDRGLITVEDPTPAPGTRGEPRIDARSAIENHTRPSIQDMMVHRVQTDDEGHRGVGNEGWSKIQHNARDAERKGAEPRQRAWTRPEVSRENPRTDRPSPNDGARREAPAPRREPAQRAEPSHRQPVQRAEPPRRSEPVQHSAPARSEPRSAPVARSAPAPRSEPASSSSSSSGSRPIKPQ
jgi:hypothetical protein